MSSTIAGVAQLAGDPLGHRARRRARRAPRRPAARRRAPRSPPGRSPRAVETRQATSQARSQRGTCAGGTAPAKRTLSPTPRLGGAARSSSARCGPSPTSASEPPPQAVRATANAASRRARFLAGTRLPTCTTRGPSRLPAERARPRPRGRRRRRRPRSTPALTMCRRSPSGPGDGLEAGAQILRDGEDRAGVADGARRLLADARRALGVGDVGAVRGERVRHAGRARRAARDRPRGHEVVTPARRRAGCERAAARARRARRAYLRSVRQPPPCSLGGHEHDLVPGALEGSHEPAT